MREKLIAGIGKNMKEPEVIDKLSRTFSVLGDSTRTRIIFALSKAENRVNAVEEAMVAHRDQLERYKHDAKKLADDLLGMADAVHQLSLEMEQQLDRLNVLTPADENER